MKVRPASYMFWWLYYTTNANVSSYYDKPLIIWLQGGPGASSTSYGNFEELGPLDADLRPRNFSWVRGEYLKETRLFQTFHYYYYSLLLFDLESTCFIACSLLLFFWMSQRARYIDSSIINRFYWMKKEKKTTRFRNPVVGK